MSRAFGLPDNFTADSRHRWSADGSLGDLRVLVIGLRALGIEPTEAAAYDAIRAATAAPAALTGRVLDQTPEDVVALAERAGVRQAASQAMATQLSTFQRQAHLELQRSMTGEAEGYIEQMRPSFDRAAAGARRCADLGIEPGDDGEQIMQRGADAVKAWLRFKTADVATLEHVAGVRILMSRALGVPPVNRGIGPDQPIDYGSCFTRPCRTFGPDDRHTKVTGWRRWLGLATNLHLTTIEELRDL